MEIRHSQDESEHVTDADVLNISTWLGTDQLVNTRLRFLLTAVFYEDYVAL